MQGNQQFTEPVDGFVLAPLKGCPFLFCHCLTPPLPIPEHMNAVVTGLDGEDVAVHLPIIGKAFIVDVTMEIVGQVL